MKLNFGTLLTIALVILKLTKTISVSWIVVFSPLVVYWVLWGLAFAILLKAVEKKNIP